MRCGASPGSHPPSGLNGTSPSKCGAEIAVVAMAGAAAAPYIEAASRGELVSLGSTHRRRATSFRKIEPNALPWHVSSQPVIERRSHGIAYADQCSPGAADALERYQPSEQAIRFATAAQCKLAPSRTDPCHATF